MDISLLNLSEIARRVNISTVYCFYLMTGQRKAEKRLRQIAFVLRMNVAELKTQIAKNQFDARFGFVPPPAHQPANNHAARAHGTPRKLGRRSGNMQTTQHRSNENESEKSSKP